MWASYTKSGNMKDLWLVALLSDLAAETIFKLEEELHEKVKTDEEFIKGVTSLFGDWAILFLTMGASRNTRVKALNWPISVRYLTKRHPDTKHPGLEHLEDLGTTIVQYVSELIVELRARRDKWETGSSHSISKASLDQISRSISTVLGDSDFQLSHAIASHMLLAMISACGSNVEFSPG